MADVVNVLKRVESVDIAPQFDSYTKVVINIDDNTQVSKGEETGRTLELDNPLFGSETMATNLLARLRGYQYQPYTATGALLDPAAEMGDGISANGVYGGIYTREREFGKLMKATVSAPHDEEINHEYKYESPQERKFTRQIGNVRASLMIQAGLIEAKVSKESPDGQTSFSWLMDDTAHTWYANGKQVMRVDADGATIDGKITAREGYIGSGSSGFAIKATALYNGMTSLNDTAHNGVYIGTDGIAIGKGAFKVTAAGNVSANNMSLTGTLNIGGTNISAAVLRQGAQSAYSNGGYWTGGAGAGYNAYNGLTGSYMQTIHLNSGVFKMNGHNVYLGTLYVSGTSYNVLRWI